MIRVHRPPDARSFLAEAGAVPRRAGSREQPAVRHLLVVAARSLAVRPGAALLRDRRGRRSRGRRRAPDATAQRRVVGDRRPGGDRTARPGRSRRDGSLPGVIGPSHAASAFARGWCELAGGAATRRMANRIYRASIATPPSGVPGAMRAYREDERALTIGWLDAFVREALPDEATDEPSDDILRRRLADPDGDVRFWEVDGAPASRWRASDSGRRTASASDRCTRRPGCAATDTPARWWAG